MPTRRGAISFTRAEQQPCSVRGIAAPGLDKPQRGILSMPSPFPGMNPYLEQDAFWQDFQLEFLPAIRGRLVAQVRPKYIVMLEEHRYVQERPPQPRRLVGHPARCLAGGAAGSAGAEEPAGVGILWTPPRRSISPCRSSAAFHSWRSEIVWGAS